ncbi:MAG: hypothetical protein JNL39_20890, partial [Opitutaceae bacterium]|nr:hypothetical protein [Opitutaceae bacterium]
AIGNKFGEPHYARISFAEPLREKSGSALTIILQHRFRDGFSIGRFRVWATTSGSPLELGLPENVVVALKATALDRTAGQQRTIAGYHRSIDPELRKREQALAIARRPLPVDPKLKQLQAALALAERPVAIDPKLAQLRADAALSEKQSAAHRLTGAQDLAWALINTPAFLFNR